MGGKVRVWVDRANGAREWWEGFRKGLRPGKKTRDIVEGSIAMPLLNPAPEDDWDEMPTGPYTTPTRASGGPGLTAGRGPFLNSPGLPTADSGNSDAATWARLTPSQSTSRPIEGLVGGRVYDPGERGHEPYPAAYSSPESESEEQDTDNETRMEQAREIMDLIEARTRAEDDYYEYRDDEALDAYLNADVAVINLVIDRRARDISLVLPTNEAGDLRGEYRNAMLTNNDLRRLYYQRQDLIDNNAEPEKIEVANQEYRRLYKLLNERLANTLPDERHSSIQAVETNIINTLAQRAQEVLRQSSTSDGLEEPDQPTRPMPTVPGTGPAAERDMNVTVPYPAGGRPGNSNPPYPEAYPPPEGDEEQATVPLPQSTAPTESTVEDDQDDVPEWMRLVREDVRDGRISTSNGSADGTSNASLQSEVDISDEDTHENVAVPYAALNQATTAHSFAPVVPSVHRGSPSNFLNDDELPNVPSSDAWTQHRNYEPAPQPASEPRPHSIRGDLNIIRAYRREPHNDPHFHPENVNRGNLLRFSDIFRTDPEAREAYRRVFDAIRRIGASYLGYSDIRNMPPEFKNSLGLLANILIYMESGQRDTNLLPEGLLEGAENAMNFLLDNAPSKHWGLRVKGMFGSWEAITEHVLHTWKRKFYASDRSNRPNQSPHKRQRARHVR